MKRQTGTVSKIEKLRLPMNTMVDFRYPNSTNDGLGYIVYYSNLVPLMNKTNKPRRKKERFIGSINNGLPNTL